MILEESIDASELTFTSDNKLMIDSDQITEISFGFLELTESDVDLLDMLHVLSFGVEPNNLYRLIYNLYTSSGDSLVAKGGIVDKHTYHAMQKNVIANENEVGIIDEDSVVVNCDVINGSRIEDSIIIANPKHGLSVIKSSKFSSCVIVGKIVVAMKSHAEFSRIVCDNQILLKNATVNDVNETKKQNYVKKQPKNKG